MRKILSLAAYLAVAQAGILQALDYPYVPYNEGKMDPQKTGWPLTEEERKYVLLPEHERRPGREINQHKPAMWPVTPSACFWGGTAWLDTHASLVKVAQASKGPMDVLLVGDSITMQWGAAWTKHFPTLKTVNIGIGGDKTQNVLWRLDHGGVDSLEPRLCVLLIGNNNMFFTPETGIEPAALGIKMCVDNLRDKFPKAPVIVVKVFPAHTPGNPFYEDIKKVNAALDALSLEADPKVRVLDIWGDMVNADGTLKKELFTPDNIHLSQEGGYKLYADKLKPLLEAFLAGKEPPKSAPRAYPASAPAASTSPASDATPAQVNAEPARAKQVIYDDKLAGGWINNPMQATVTLDNNSPVASGSKSIAVNSTPYGGFQVLRWGTALDTTLCKSLTFRINGGAKGCQNLRVAMMNGPAEGRRWQIVPVPEANAWTKFSISLADLGVANTRNVYGLRIWEADGVDATYYLDDIQLSDEEVPSLGGVVFDDIFRGFWFNNAFAAEVVATNTTPVHGGVRSLAVKITGGGGCAQISHGGAFPDTSPYNSLSFWIHGGTEGGQKLHLFVKRWNVDVPVWTIPALKPNEWVKHTVPLSTLGAANATNVASLWFRDANTGTAQPTFYLDDIRFEAASGASPASAAKPAPVASKTAAPAAAKPTPSEAQKPSPAMPGGVAPQPTTIKDGVLVYSYAPYNAGKMDPQLTGWPLTDDERAFVLKPEHDRRPGREENQHKPAMWPVTPSAGNWGGTAWLDTHAGFCTVTKANPGPLDILLVGDSITMQWGGIHQHNKPFNAPWKKNFGQYRALNIGIGGDKAQNVLWRLDHGNVDGLEPRLIVLMIGNNNMFFTPETGIEPVALGIKACLDNLRAKFPKAFIVLAKILPAGAPSDRFYQDMKKTNEALDPLKLDADPLVQMIDMWSDFTHADGTLKTELFTQDKIHLNDAGYEVWAGKLKPIVEKVLGGKSVGKPIVPPSAATHAPASASGGKSTPTPGVPSDAMLQPTPRTADGKRLVYPYAPYNEGKMDPQLTGWPLTDAEKAWVAKGEYTRKPGHELQKHLPEMWFITPTAGRWGKDGEDNVWVAHHATCIEKVRAMKDGIDIALLGDSITQGWGGGWDGAPFSAAWQKHFSGLKTVNLGIGGDRMESILWRLDHGALDGAVPKVIVLKIGVNNAPLVFANGAPAATAAHGIKLCIENLRVRCPKSQIVLVKILPAFDPAKEAGKAVVDINAALDALTLDRDPQVHILDLWSDFTNTDGTLKTALYSDGHLHLGPAGYEVIANKLKPLLDRLLGRKGAGAKAVTAADAGAKQRQPRELPPCGVRLTIVEEHPAALIVKGSPGTEGNKHGFEGGRAIKLDGVYHIFTAEMVGDPVWVKMKLGHWTSPDRLKWTRRGTMYESSGDPTGKDPRASFWSPMPVYNEKEECWNFFYVAYRAQVGPLGWNGRIWRAVSTVKGTAGINGPWEDVGVILQPGPAGGAWEEAVMKGGVSSIEILKPGPESDAWEGSQGVDSFFPYQVGDKWLGFYGSCNGHNWFKVGLAEAPELAGPWKRLSAMNPVDLVGTRGPENPVVHRLSSGRYIALFEVVARENGFGYADSPDGIHWTKGSELPLTEAPKRIRKVRTPLGLVPEPDGSFTVFFTGYARSDSYGEIWMVRVRVEERAHDGAEEIQTKAAHSTEKDPNHE